ncbi:heavy-metal-associated domain-containing protein [Alicyclobacillus cycloheptanicus]|nr:heavy-metal-associated domain-containing protein [Alicyclobacillus cycloheptanicus]
MNISVEGLNVNTVTKALKSIRGVAGVDVDLSENLAIVTFDETEVNGDVLRRAVMGTKH